MATPTMAAKKELPEELLAQIREVVKKATDQAEATIKEGIEGLFRFYGMDPYPATCELLEECGPLLPEEIAAELANGGIAGHQSDARGGAAADVKRSISHWVSRADSKIERLADGRIGLKK